MGTTEAKSLQAKDILTNANHTIIQRELTHGDYNVTMLRTAKLWSDFLEREIDPMDVAVCMALVKLARIMDNGKHIDSWNEVNEKFGVKEDGYDEECDLEELDCKLSEKYNYVCRLDDYWNEVNEKFGVKEDGYDEECDLEEVEKE